MATGNNSESAGSGVDSSTTSTVVPGPFDRGLHALFGHHARGGHDRTRARFHAANRSGSFDRYLVRVYGLSWLLGVGVSLAVLLTVGVLPRTTFAAVVTVVPGIPASQTGGLAVVVAVASLFGLLTKVATVRASGLYPVPAGVAVGERTVATGYGAVTLQVWYA